MDSAAIRARYAAAAASWTGASGSGSAPAAGDDEATNIAKLDPCLQQAFEAATVKGSIQAKCGEIGLVSPSLLFAFADSREKARNFLRTRCGVNH